MSDERNSLAWAGIAATKANETPNARMDSIFRIYPPASLEEKCRHPIEGCVHGSCRNAIMLFRTASLLRAKVTSPESLQAHVNAPRARGTRAVQKSMKRWFNTGRDGCQERGGRE